jgi:hypothetical protein
LLFLRGVFPPISGILENVPWGKISRNFQKFPEFSEIFRKFSRNFPPEFPGFRTRGKTKIQPVNCSFFCQNPRKFPPDFPEFWEISEISEFRDFPPQKRGKTQKYKCKSGFDPGENPGKLRGKFPKNSGNFCQDFTHFCQKIPKKCPKITHVYSREIYRHENDANG